MKNLVLAIDPGLASGVCLLQVEPLEILATDELDWLGTARFADQILREHGGENVDVVCERFTITQQTSKNSQQTWSLEIIGMIRLLCHIYGAGELKLQSPADAKRFATNPRLKSLELWHVGGEGHALDAIRHAVLRLVNLGWRDSRLLHE